MTNIGPDGCDARDTAPEEPPEPRDQLVDVWLDGDAVFFCLLTVDGDVQHYRTNALLRPDAQLLARSIYDVLEGEDHDAR